MKDVGCSCLHASNADRFESFAVLLGVPFLPQDQMSILDLYIARIKPGVEANVVIV